MYILNLYNLLSNVNYSKKIFIVFELFLISTFIFFLGGTYDKFGLVTNKCVIDRAMTFIHTHVFHHLTVEHRRLLFLTPFLHLFVFPKKMQVSNGILHTILSFYDNRNGCFNILGKEVYFTSDCVANFLCLPNEGLVVDLSQVRVSTSPLREKYFPHHKQIRRPVIEEVIKKVVQDKNSNARDVVSLLVLYIFTTVLFPNTAGSVPLQLFRYAK